MVAGDLVIMDYQYEYNNLLLGCETSYDIEEWSGLVGYPSVRSTSQDAFGRHGGVAGRHYLPARDFSCSAHIKGEDDTTFASLRAGVGTAFGVRTDPSSEIPLVYKHPGANKRFINCRPIDMNLPVNRSYALMYPDLAIRFEATDPRHYDLINRYVTTTIPTPAGGLDFPLDFPLDFGGSGTSGATLITPAGNAPAHWIGVVNGPVTSPKIEFTFDLTGQTYWLEMLGLVVEAGDELTFSSRYRTVKVSGQSRRTYLTPQSIWTTLPPSPETVTVRYTSGDSIVTGSTLTIMWNDAYWGD